MKKILFILFAIQFLFGSCDKWPENGDLDGMWQLMEFSHDGTKSDMKAERLFCSFQLKVFMLGSKTAGGRAYFGYFEHTDDMIRFHHFTFRSQYTEDANVDELMTDDDIDKIRPWGFYSIDSRYKIEELTGNSMILIHEQDTLKWRKY